MTSGVLTCRTPRLYDDVMNDTSHRERPNDEGAGREMVSDGRGLGQRPEANERKGDFYPKQIVIK